MNDIDKLKELRLRILKASHITREGHIASAFSVIDIIYTLYRYWLWHSPLDPKLETRDYFILSKGHGAMALYAVLADMGFFDPSWLDTYYQKDSILGGHPDRMKVPGVEVSTGSLGHGLPMAIGLAMALKLEGKDNKVVCLVGDGELNEGSCWESLLLAGYQGRQDVGLGNLTVIVDYNHSTDAALDLKPLMGKVLGFGWEQYEIDGHNIEEIGQAINARSLPEGLPPPTNTLPKFIVANTVKGKGIKTIEANPQVWHHRSPTTEELAKFIEELSPTEPKVGTFGSSLTSPDYHQK